MTRLEYLVAEHGRLCKNLMNAGSEEIAIAIHKRINEINHQIVNA